MNRTLITVAFVQVSPSAEGRKKIRSNKLLSGRGRINGQVDSFRFYMWELMTIRICKRQGLGIDRPKSSTLFQFECALNPSGQYSCVFRAKKWDYSPNIWSQMTWDSQWKRPNSTAYKTILNFLLTKTYICQTNRVGRVVCVMLKAASLCKN